MFGALLQLWHWWKRAPATGPDSAHVNLCAEIRRLRRQVASARAHEDVVLRENAILRKDLVFHQERQEIAERECRTLAVLVDRLRAESAAGKLAGSRLVPLPDLPPGWVQLGSGPYMARFTVVAPDGGGAFVQVAAASRVALRSVLEPFTAIDALSAPPILVPPTKECEGQ